MPDRASLRPHLDIDPHAAADVLDHIATVDKFPGCFAQAIYPCHILTPIVVPANAT